MEVKMFMREKKKRRLLKTLPKKQRKIIEEFPENVQVHILSQLNDGYSISVCNSQGVSMRRNSITWTINISTVRIV
ncbi:MAG: hypothetical protein UW92_C0019G0002 [Candidatus Jorgensenbacteria bacterium GW2011_GWA2_45_13]|uniref:Uncharacterized protein n=1 Tax=Candidatus Jorgensenbacteria bacterium GW2011_GWA2_45_13 TaxID=1618662 RepID=A0A0G1ND46_9BACT|nr:MAG: hypothetical protein UW92_C0019G0002 [Candidatus Jorgensenbacteria bacterium GW2011_GWA2_45_13]